MVPKSVAVFVEFSQSPAAHAVRDVVTKFLLSNCLKVEEGDLLGYDVKLSLDLAADLAVSESSEKALNISYQNDSVKVNCVSLSDAVEYPERGTFFAVVDWTTSTLVSAKIQPIDSGSLF